MVTFWSSCPGCMHASVQNRTPRSTTSLNHSTPWATNFGCGRCGQTWFVCSKLGCSIPAHKNIFLTRLHLQRHARHWHVSASVERTSLSVAGNNNEGPTGAPEEQMDAEIFVDNPDLDDTIESNIHFPYCFLQTGTAQFADWCIAGSVTQATNCLVQQSLVQAPVNLFMDASSQLPPHAIQLFLHIAQMLVTTGQKHHTVLSHILTLLLGLLPTQHDNWPTMPSTILPTNTHWCLYFQFHMCTC